MDIDAPLSGFTDYGKNIRDLCIKGYGPSSESETPDISELNTAKITVHGARLNACERLRKEILNGMGFADYKKDMESVLALIPSSDADQLTPECAKRLEQELYKLISDVFSTKAPKMARELFRVKCAETRLQLIREMYMRFSAQEFADRRKKFGLDGVRRAMALENGSPYQNPNFLQEKSLSGKTYGDLIENTILNLQRANDLSIEQSAQLVKFATMIMWHESRGDALAFSPSYCLGIGQLYSGLYLKSDQYEAINPLNPEQAIPRSIEYALSLLKQFNWHEELAATAYNAGPGAVKNALKFEAEMKMALQISGPTAGKGTDYINYLYRYEKGKIKRDAQGNPVINTEAQQYYRKAKKDWRNIAEQYAQVFG